MTFKWNTILRWFRDGHSTSIRASERLTNIEIKPNHTSIDSIQSSKTQKQVIRFNDWIYWKSVFTHNSNNTTNGLNYERLTIDRWTMEYKRDERVLKSIFSESITQKLDNEKPSAPQVRRARSLYILCIWKIFQDNSLPFWLQSFPKPIVLVNQFLIDRASRILDKSVDDIVFSVVVAGMVTLNSWAIEVSHNLELYLQWRPFSSLVVTASSLMWWGDDGTVHIHVCTNGTDRRDSPPQEIETYKVERDSYNVNHMNIVTAMQTCKVNKKANPLASPLLRFKAIIVLFSARKVCMLGLPSDRWKNGS